MCCCMHVTTTGGAYAKTHEPKIGWMPIQSAHICSCALFGCGHLISTTPPLHTQVRLAASQTPLFSGMHIVAISKVTMSPVPHNDRVALCTLVENGLSLSEAARQVGVPRTTAAGIWAKYKATGDCSTSYKGREKQISARTERKIMRDIASKPYVGIKDIADANGVSSSSVWRVAKACGWRTYPQQARALCQYPHRAKGRARATINADTD